MKEHFIFNRLIGHRSYVPAHVIRPGINREGNNQLQSASSLHPHNIISATNAPPNFPTLSELPTGDKGPDMGGGHLAASGSCPRKGETRIQSCRIFKISKC